MRNTIQTALRVGLTFGTLLLGTGTVSMLNGPSRSDALAAGLVTTISAIQVAAEPIGLATITADPKPRETITPAGGRGEPQDGASLASAKPWDFKLRSPIVMKIEKALLDPTEVNFTDIPLKDALVYLEGNHHIDILTDAKTLSEEGISTDTTVTLVMSGISLRSALRLMLSPLSLDYVIKNDVLVVTTETVASEIYDIRVYNTSRLPNLAPKELVDIITSVVVPGNWTIKKVSETRAAKVFAPGAKTEVPSLNRTASGESDPVPAPKPADADAQKPVEGGGNDGGSLGSICAVANTLVIRQTRRVHEEIIELLDQLERQQATAQSKPAKP